MRAGHRSECGQQGRSFEGTTEKAPWGRPPGSRNPWQKATLPAVLDGCWQARGARCQQRQKAVGILLPTRGGQSHRKVTVSSGRPSPPAFSLSLAVWRKASHVEKAPGWELPPLISIHSTLQRESGLRRERPWPNSAPWHNPLRTS